MVNCFIDMIRSASCVKEEDQVFSFVLQINGVTKELNKDSFPYLMEQLKHFESKKKKKSES